MFDTGNRLVGGIVLHDLSCLITSTLSVIRTMDSRCATFTAALTDRID